MAEEQRPDSGGSPPPAALNKLDADWGDDWESAFQSEEGADPAEEDALSFADIGIPGDGETDSESVAEAAAGGEEEEGERAPANAAALLRNLLAFALVLPQKFGQIPALAVKLGQRFAALSTPRKIITAGGAVVLVALSAIVLSLLSHPPAPEILRPDDPFGLADQSPPGSPLFSPESSLAPAAPGPGAEILSTPSETLALPAPPGATFQRHNLELKGFFIPLEEQFAGGGQSYLHLDLTLVLRLAPAATLDPVTTPRLRDTIYRFYQRQSPETLRRFSLARGEMLRELRLWLEEHAGQPEIEAISFNRYWIN